MGAPACSVFHFGKQCLNDDVTRSTNIHSISVTQPSVLGIGGVLGMLSWTVSNDHQCVANLLLQFLSLLLADDLLPLFKFNFLPACTMRAHRFQWSSSKMCSRRNNMPQLFGHIAAMCHVQWEASISWCSIVARICFLEHLGFCVGNLVAPTVVSHLKYRPRNLSQKCAYLSSQLLHVVCVCATLPSLVRTNELMRKSKKTLLVRKVVDPSLFLRNTGFYVLHVF